MQHSTLVKANVRTLRNIWWHMDGGHNMLERMLCDMAAAFDQGDLADRVVTAIARSSAHKSLREADLRAIQEADEFLDRVQEGYRWVRTR